MIQVLIASILHCSRGVVFPNGIRAFVAAPAQLVEGVPISEQLPGFEQVNFLGSTVVRGIPGNSHEVWRIEAQLSFADCRFRSAKCPFAL